MTFSSDWQVFRAGERGFVAVAPGSGDWTTFRSSERTASSSSGPRVTGASTVRSSAEDPRARQAPFVLALRAPGAANLTRPSGTRRPHQGRPRVETTLTTPLLHESRSQAGRSGYSVPGAEVLRSLS